MMAGQGVSGGGARQSPDGSLRRVLGSLSEPQHRWGYTLGSVRVVVASVHGGGTSQEVISRRRRAWKVLPSRESHQLLPDCGPRHWSNKTSRQENIHNAERKPGVCPDEDGRVHPAPSK